MIIIAMTVSSLQAGLRSFATLSHWQLSHKLNSHRQLKLFLAVLAAAVEVTDQSHFQELEIRVKAPVPNFSTFVDRLFAWGGSGPCRIGLLALPKAEPMSACLQTALLAEEPHGGPA